MSKFTDETEWLQIEALRLMVKNDPSKESWAAVRCIEALLNKYDEAVARVEELEKLTKAGTIHNDKL